MYSFRGGPYDGRYPQTGLTYFNGTFYGTTTEGGVGECYTSKVGCGTVYSITPSGRETVLYSFKGGKDGESPHARLIVHNGTLYGTTNRGGGTCLQTSLGCGTVFSITPSGHETVLHEFAGPPDGSRPEARLLNVNGTLYGTTYFGGVNCAPEGCGTVFSITPGGKEKVLYSFRGGTDGAVPESGLTYFKGSLYGTTNAGGAYTDNGHCSGAACGTVFSVTPSGKEKVLHSFGNGEDGTEPEAGLVEVNGTLYGTTSYGGSGNCGVYGCGTVFSMTPSGKETVLFSFNDGNGAAPAATLLNVNGTLYGTTPAGGEDEDGIVFSMTPSGYETVLYIFEGGQDGAYPESGLSYVNGRFYGTTSAGGGEQSGCCGNGTVYSIRP